MPDAALQQTAGIVAASLLAMRWRARQGGKSIERAAAGLHR